MTGTVIVKQGPLPVPGSSVLDWAQIEADATRAATSYADTALVIPDLEVPDGPIEVIFSCAALSNDNANGGAKAALVQDTTVLGAASQLEDTAGYGVAVTRTILYEPGAGTYTFKVRLKTLFSGTARIQAQPLGAGGSTDIGPAQLVVKKA
jgi:hypothetical protein